MKNVILTMALAAFTAFGANAQEEAQNFNTQGDWYVGTGDIANTAWTNWSLQPTVGYAFADNFMIGLTVAQGTELDDTGETVAGDMTLGVTARYFFGDYFGFVGSESLTGDYGLNIGAGRMFTLGDHGVYLDPRLSYNTLDKTTNMRLGFGLKF